MRAQLGDWFQAAEKEGACDRAREGGFGKRKSNETDSSESTGLTCIVLDVAFYILPCEFFEINICLCNG